MVLDENAAFAGSWREQRIIIKLPLIGILFLCHTPIRLVGSISGNESAIGVKHAHTPISVGEPLNRLMCNRLKPRFTANRGRGEPDSPQVNALSAIPIGRGARSGGSVWSAPLVPATPALENCRYNLFLPGTVNRPSVLVAAPDCPVGGSVSPINDLSGDHIQRGSRSRPRSTFRATVGQVPDSVLRCGR